MRRNIIQIDQEKCVGCGLCVDACHEGALKMVDGKAQLVSDTYCDGLGACLPECPADAIAIVQREAAAFDEVAVQANHHLSRKVVDHVPMPVAPPAPPVSEPTSPSLTTPSLTAILATNVREVIDRFPAIGKLLDEYAIHCATCSLGTCRLQDIVDIHGLSSQQETALLTRMAELAFPGLPVQIPHLERRTAAARTTGPVRFSPPLRELVEEHTVIKRAIALLPVLAASLTSGLNEVSRRQVQELLAFVRNFADRFHHAKEEDLLFPLFEDAGEIITSMRAEHEVGRGHVRAAAAALAADDAAAVVTHLNAYAALLTEHIRKEDEILYPWMDRALNDTQIGRLFAAFRDVETRFGEGPAMERAVVTRLENENATRPTGENK